MADDLEHKKFVIDCEKLPADFPTHRHSAEFWEALGRTVAAFGFLERILAGAIFSFTATRRLQEDELEVAFEKWLPTLERALSDPLGGLIDSYGKAVRDNSDATITKADLDELLKRLREASKLRNVICHGAWDVPDNEGRSFPFFVDRKKGLFETPIDIAWLREMQVHVAELTCLTINTVTRMGWQFPGSRGPGNPIFQLRC